MVLGHVVPSQVVGGLRPPLQAPQTGACCRRLKAPLHSVEIGAYQRLYEIGASWAPPQRPVRGPLFSHRSVPGSALSGGFVLRNASAEAFLPRKSRRVPAPRHLRACARWRSGSQLPHCSLSGARRTGARLQRNSGDGSAAARIHHPLFSLAPGPPFYEHSLRSQVLRCPSLTSSLGFR